MHSFTVGKLQRGSPTNYKRLALLLCRRQTSEEREAERQAASRYLINLQAEVLQNAAGAAGGAAPKSDPLIFNNAALNAMQSLQPWSSSKVRKMSADLKNGSNEDDDEEQDDDIIDNQTSLSSDKEDEDEWDHEAEQTAQLAGIV